MNIAIVVPTSGVEDGKPKEWFAQRLDAAIDCYDKNSNGNQITFIVSGRWNNVDEEFDITEAEVAKRYIVEKLPEVKIIKEDIAVETGGNIAFTKPLVAACDPDKIVVVCSKVHLKRIEYLVGKIYDPDWDVKYIGIDDSLSQNPRAQAKEPKALHMFETLLGEIKAGEDAKARDILLYGTPFYYRGIFDQQAFFDEHWPGGFADFKEKRLSIHNK